MLNFLSRSREKRRLNDMLLERRVLELTKENWILKAQIRGVFDNYGIRAEETLSGVAIDRILAAMPSNEQILAFNSRSSSSRRDSLDLEDPRSSSMGFSDICSDESAPALKKPKIEIAEEPLSATTDRWAGVSHNSSLAPKSEGDESWGRETEEEEISSRPPTRQETDDWGALNLSSNSSDNGYDHSRLDRPSSDQHGPFSLSPCSSSASSNSPPIYLLPHKLRFKHSTDLSHEESDENTV